MNTSEHICSDMFMVLSHVQNNYGHGGRYQIKTFRITTDSAEMNDFLPWITNGNNLITDSTLPKEAI